MQVNTYILGDKTPTIINGRTFYLKNAHYVVDEKGDFLYAFCRDYRDERTIAFWVSDCVRPSTFDLTQHRPFPDTENNIKLMFEGKALEQSDQLDYAPYK